MKVLFAEDEMDLQEVVTAYLEYQGYHVTAVCNGAQAVEKAKTDAFDAIVLDVMMPVMDGVTAMKKIRGAGNTIPGKREEEHFDTDDLKLEFLQRYGWLIDDDEVRAYSAKYKPNR